MREFWVTVGAMVLGYVLHFVPDRFEARCKRTFTRLPMMCYVLALVVMMVLIVQVKSSDIQPFVYFQF